MHKSESEVAQWCPNFRDPMDYSLLGSSIHGIFQARVLEWVAIAFSNMWLTISNELILSERDGFLQHGSGLIQLVEHLQKK